MPKALQPLPRSASHASAADDRPGMKEIGVIGVLGAGTMGTGIAQVAAEANLDVLIHDPIAGAVDAARQRVAGFLARRVEKGQLTTEDARAAEARIRRTETLEAVALADLVIEAIPEQLETKLDAFRRLDNAAAPETTLATNTSSLSIARIAGATAHPDRVVGMHFFNPVPMMALVEVVAGPMTADAVVDHVALIARLLGKTPVIAADTPGFIVNRVARPYYLEALRILGEGSAGIEEIDSAMRGIDFPAGPFELIDLIGADVNLAVSISVHEQFFGEPRFRPHVIQRRLVDAGRLGRKAGGGFYDYDPDGGRGPAWSGIGRRALEAPTARQLETAQIEARILAAIVNEAAMAVADGVAAPAAIDTAMRLGTNWPDGPLAWGERIGLASVVHTLDALHALMPDGRYGVAPLLRSLAEGGGSFFATEPH
jgi:3-hydroxybutyryl-CoA dehydrogenase